MLRILFTVILGVIAFSMLVPFLWMLSASFKRVADVLKLPIKWIPSYWYPDNYINVWNIGGKAIVNYHFGLSYANSLKIAFINLTGAVLTSTLAGYAFAKIPFRGRNALFLIYLSTMMVPTQVTLIPRFVMFNRFGMLGSHLPLILPGLVTITGTFLMRQHFLQVPNELKEAAIIDGASELKIWSRIMVPIAKPSMAALAMLVFLWNWNNYLDALVFLSNWRLYTIPVALTNFVEESLTEYNLVMAASASALIPIFGVFLAGQRFFVKGIIAGAVKG
jgi:multiple sugar transport system permease protein